MRPMENPTARKMAAKPATEKSVFATRKFTLTTVGFCTPNASASKNKRIMGTNINIRLSTFRTSYK